MRSSHPADKKMREKFLSQPMGILGTSKQGADARSVYGDNRDIFLILKDYIVNHSIYIAPSATNVLNVVNLSSNTELFDVLNDTITTNKDHEFRLLIPVNFNNAHWCVIDMSVDQGRIAVAKLWDPMASDTSRLRDGAVQSLQKVVSAVNKDTLIQVQIEKGAQTNGHSCLDYCAQHILKKLDVKNAITRASTAEVLRQAVVEAVIKNDAELQKLSQSPMVEEGCDDSEDEASTDTVEEAEEKTVVTKLIEIDYLHSHDEEALHELFVQVEHKDIQEQFDAVMANKLNELFQQQSTSEEKVLFQQARRYAYTDLLNKFSITAHTDVPVKGDKEKVSPGILKA